MIHREETVGRRSVQPCYMEAHGITYNSKNKINRKKNGEGERAVQTVNNLLRKNNNPYFNK